MKIHAYRRREAITVTLNGAAIKFAPNEGGDVVADVEDQVAAERLLDITEAYRPYESSPNEGGDEGGSEAEGLLVKVGDQDVDLSKLTAKPLRELAAQAGVALPEGKTPIAELRQMLADAIHKSAEDSQ